MHFLGQGFCPQTGHTKHPKSSGEYMAWNDVKLVMSRSTHFKRYKNAINSFKIFHEDGEYFLLRMRAMV